MTAGIPDRCRFSRPSVDALVVLADRPHRNRLARCAPHLPAGAGWVEMVVVFAEPAVALPSAGAGLLGIMVLSQAEKGSYITRLNPATQRPSTSAHFSIAPPVTGRGSIGGSVASRMTVPICSPRCNEGNTSVSALWMPL